MSRSSSPKRRRHSNARRHDRDLLRMCRESGGKRRFPNRKHALSGLNHALAHPFGNGRGGTPIAVYRCPHCKDWHLTSKEQRA